MSQLHSCELCGAELQTGASRISLQNSIPVVDGRDSSVLNGKTAFIKDAELCNLFKDKLSDSEQSVLYVCDSCLEANKGTRFLWLDVADTAVRSKPELTRTVDYTVNVERDANHPLNRQTIVVPQGCTAAAYSYNTEKQKLFDTLSTDESFLHTTSNGVSVDRYIVNNPDNILIVSRIDNANLGLEITEVRENQVLVVYSATDFEVLDEKEFIQKFSLAEED